MWLVIHPRSDVIDETGVKFTDGSTAELSNRLVINVGKGEIRLLSSEDVDEWIFTSTFRLMNLIM